jgi:hypothetical protein
MASAPDSTIVSLLYQALEADIGIAVSVTNPSTAKQKFYATRRLLADPALDALQFRTSPHNTSGELWIVKGEPK